MASLTAFIFPDLPKSRTKRNLQKAEKVRVSWHISCSDPEAFENKEQDTKNCLPYGL